MQIVHCTTLADALGSSWICIFITVLVQQMAVHRPEEGGPFLNLY